MEEVLIDKILKRSKKIAVVGLSGDPVKPSYIVSKYLKDHGYVVIPVNPAIDEWLGERSFPDIASIPERPDLVVVFRRPERAIQFVKAAAEKGVKTVWLQEGVGSEEARRIADERDLELVMDECIMKEHKKRNAGRRPPSSNHRAS